MQDDIKWMKLAIIEANKAEKKGEVPVGAILVQHNKIVARAHNKSIATHDASAHAEILLLRKSGKKLQNYRLNNCTLYVTLEPCAMCFGAIMHGRIKRVVYGAYDLKTGVCGSSIDLTNSVNFHHKIEILGGVLEKNCKIILQDFFKKKRH